MGLPMAEPAFVAHPTKRQDPLTVAHAIEELAFVLRHVAIPVHLYASTVTVAPPIAPPAFVVPVAGALPDTLTVALPLAPPAFVAPAPAPFKVHRKNTLAVMLAVAELAFVAPRFPVGVGSQGLIRQDASTVGKTVAPLAFVVSSVGVSSDSPAVRSATRRLDRGEHPRATRLRSASRRATRLRSACRSAEWRRPDRGEHPRGSRLRSASPHATRLRSAFRLRRPCRTPRSALPPHRTPTPESFYRPSQSPWSRLTGSLPSRPGAPEPRACLKPASPERSLSPCAKAGRPATPLPGAGRPAPREGAPRSPSNESTRGSVLRPLGRMEAKTQGVSVRATRKPRMTYR